MSSSTHSNNQHGLKGKDLKKAVELLSQQIWCWGRDIERPEGNWLLEIGFNRLESPADRESCASVYTLELPHGQGVILRGFGVFFGDDGLGGIFMPRYVFRPKFTTEAVLECPPWADEDLPKLRHPTEQQIEAWTSLTLDLINWIKDYETAIVKRLGIEYRESTLLNWNNGKRKCIQAQEMASSWQDISNLITSNEDHGLSQR